MITHGAKRKGPFGIVAVCKVMGRHKTVLQRVTTPPPIDHSQCTRVCWDPCDCLYWLAGELGRPSFHAAMIQITQVCLSPCVCMSMCELLVWLVGAGRLAGCCWLLLVGLHWSVNLVYAYARGDSRWGSRHSYPPKSATIIDVWLPHTLTSPGAIATATTFP